MAVTRAAAQSVAFSVFLFWWETPIQDQCTKEQIFPCDAVEVISCELSAMKRKAHLQNVTICPSTEHHFGLIFSLPPEVFQKVCKKFTDCNNCPNCSNCLCGDGPMPGGHLDDTCQGAHKHACVMLELNSMLETQTCKQVTPHKPIRLRKRTFHKTLFLVLDRDHIFGSSSGMHIHALNGSNITAQQCLPKK